MKIKILVIFFAFLFIANFAQAEIAVKPIVIYKESGKILSYVNNQDNTFSFFINNKPIVFSLSLARVANDDGEEMLVESAKMLGYDFKLYKTNIKNIVLIKHGEASYGDSPDIYAFIDLQKGKEILGARVDYLIFTHCYASKKPSNLTINGRDAGVDYDPQSCDEKIKSKTEANKAKPQFKGFTIYDGAKHNIGREDYQAKQVALLKCLYESPAGGPVVNGFKQASVCKAEVELISFSSDLKKVFFSAAGFGWKASYAFSVNSNNSTYIHKEQPRNLLKLTLVKNLK